MQHGSKGDSGMSRSRRRPPLVFKLTRDRVFKIKMYPAVNGDCFLIRGAGANFLIDGGYADTFKQHLKPDLLQIAQEGERLDLLIATHIDQDHILGVIAFLKANGAVSPRTFVEVAAVWFNSLRGLAVEVSTALPTAPRRLLAAISRQGYQLRSNPGASARISARQGSSLGSIIRRGCYNWNGGDGAVCIKETTNSMDISNDAFIRVLGPTMQRLEDLHRLWLGELTKRGYAGPLGSNDELDEAFEWSMSTILTAQRQLSWPVEAGNEFNYLRC